MEKAIKRIVNHADESEKVLEAYLVSKVEAVGGVCLKYSNPNAAGYPDRICIVPNAAFAVEVKSRGCKPRKLQLVRIASLRALGFPVFVVDSREAIDNIIYLQD